jgi:membrane protein involved in colicin uptake
MSKTVKTSFKKHELSKGMLISLGQFTHRMTTRMTIWSAGYKVRSIQPLEKEAALAAGAEFVGEAFIFTVGGAVVVWEYDKSKEKERVKEEDNKMRERRQEERLHDLQTRMTDLEKRVTNNIQNIEELLSILEQNQRQQQQQHDAEIKRKKAWLW